MSAPIRPCLLVDTATVTDPDGSADYEGAQLDPYTIERVRLDADTVRSSDTWGDSHPQGGATLYIDARNSEPAKAPAIGSEVTVTRGDAEVYEGTVEDVKPCLDETSVHHWEETLS